MHQAGSVHSEYIACIKLAHHVLHQMAHYCAACIKIIGSVTLCSMHQASLSLCGLHAQELRLNIVCSVNWVAPPKQSSSWFCTLCSIRQAGSNDHSNHQVRVYRSAKCIHQAGSIKFIQPIACIKLHSTASNWLYNLCMQHAGIKLAQFNPPFTSIYWQHGMNPFFITLFVGRH